MTIKNTIQAYPILYVKLGMLRNWRITMTRRMMAYFVNVNLTKDMSYFISLCFYVHCYFGYTPKYEKEINRKNYETKS